MAIAAGDGGLLKLDPHGVTNVVGARNSFPARATANN